MDIKGKVALVTGAGSGIGEEVAKIYAKHGAKLVLTDVDEEGLKKVADSLKDQGAEVITVIADVSKAEDSENSVKQAVEKFGGLHIACNNAGVGGPSAPVGEMEIDGWNNTIAINLSGVFYGMRYQIPAMLEAGGGSIVNIASILGQVGMAGSGAYVAAKHGVVGLTKNAALEYSKEGVRINAVGPGFIKTPLLTENLDEDQMKQITALHPIGRMGEPEEVAELVLWLSSDKASFATGAYYPVDGAYLAQ